MKHPMTIMLGCECEECKGNAEELYRARKILDKHKVRYREVDM